MQVLLDRGVEGWVVIIDRMPPGITFLADLRRSRVPIVIVGREVNSSGVSTVSADNESNQDLGGGRDINLLRRALL